MRAIVVMLVAGCLAVAGAAYAQEQSRELRRLTTREDTRGWEAVGRVETPGGYCTGTLIATDLVLTAAHCVLADDTGAKIPPEDVVFRAGLRGLEMIAERTALRIAPHPRYDPVLNTAENARYDAALIELAAPILATDAAPFTVVPLAPSLANVSVVSFAEGRDEAASLQRVCTVLERQDGFEGLDCDADHGASGAPVFDISGRRGRIIGIIRGGTTWGAREVTLAIDVSALLGEMRTELRRAATFTPNRGAGNGSGTGGAKFVRP